MLVFQNIYLYIITMIAPELPKNEKQRLQALKTLQILDTLPEERFDRLTRLAQNIFQVPIALISLIDEHRQWFKSKQGLSAQQTPREISFCGHAILNSKILYIPDTLKDKRFYDNPLVIGNPNIRFYAGAPLTVIEGYSIGTLCIIDDKPKELSNQQLQCLRDLADLVQEELQSIKLQAAITHIQQQEQQLKVIVDNIVDGIIMIDNNNYILSCNPSLKTIFDYNFSELEQKPITKILPGFSNQRSQQYIKGIKKSQETIETRVNIQQSILKQKTVFILVIHDISEQKKLEKIKNDFISTVSHELRTPLTAIQGALGLILSGVTQTLSLKTKNLLDIAYNNTKRLTYLINDILDIEKIEAGKIIFSFEIITLDKILPEIIQRNQSYADQFSVNFQFHNQAPNVQIKADKNRLEQVLTNLLSNACKFSHKNSRIDIFLSKENHSIKIAVQDYGEGIPETFKKNIFQKFAQVDSSDAKKKGGTGLGLSITKALVEKMQGQINFDSVYGQGSIFYCYFPEIEPNA